MHLLPYCKGLDPISRRMIWDAIHWMKKTRVVVLTTHNMDEADFMVMHHGRVRAHGDPM
jgi:ABC-type multidrug transport system ATPase subunit